MTEKAVFFIEGREFQVGLDYAGAESFKVDSVLQSYSVVWDSSINALATVNDLMIGSGNLLLIDENVYNLYAHLLGDVPTGRIFKAEATEKFKTLDGITAVYQFLEDNAMTKGETLVVVGGGIIQDVAAFVGATYKRGIPWIYFPTTLLSMCDSCIGGKASINHNGAKNQLGLFSAPSRIVINPNFLDTLNPREIISGLGEILKLHITGGKAFIENFLKYVKDPTAIEKQSFRALIMGSLAVKKAVIEIDEFDRSYRKALNYGHTIGHAVETLSKYAIPHGQAIMVGMIVVNELSRRRSILSLEEDKTIKRIMLNLLDNTLLCRFSVEGLQELLKKDKKSTGDNVNFAILKSMGNFGFLKVKNDTILFDEIKGIIEGLA